MSESRKYDVILLGSGISSLTAAALLAQNGRSVLVLEAYNKVGGYMHCFQRQGHRFDTGAHYVGAMDEGQSFWALLKYIGVYNQDDFVPLDPEGFDQFYFPEFDVSMPKGYQATIKRLCEQFPSEKSAIEKFYALSKEAVQFFPTYVYSDKPEIEMSLQFLKMSLAQVVESLTNNKDLKSVLYAYCSLHGVEPSQVSFGLHALMVDSLITGPYGFAHGGEAVVKRFVDKIESHGGKVLTRKRVSELVVKDRMIVEVKTEDGDSFVGDWIISGIHPKTTFKLLSSLEGFTQAFHDRMNSITESIGIVGLYTVMEESMKVNPLRNYYFFKDSRPDDFFKTTKPGDMPGVVFASPANRLGTLEAKGIPMNFHSAGPIQWFEEFRGSRIGQRPKEYVHRKDEIAQQMLNLAGQYMPGLKEKVFYKQASTPLTNLFFNGSVDGSAFGIHHSMENTGIRALGPRTKILNLLLTGQSTLFPGLMASATSGLRTSAHLLGMKPLVREIKRYFKNEAHL